MRKIHDHIMSVILCSCWLYVVLMLHLKEHVSPFFAFVLAAVGSVGILEFIVRLRD